MTGFIRFFAGFLIVFGAMGAIESVSNAVLVVGVISALIGLGFMSSGAAALSRAR